jgi:hypothetical protein
MFMGAVICFTKKTEKPISSYKTELFVFSWHRLYIAVLVIHERVSKDNSPARRMLLERAIKPFQKRKHEGNHLYRASVWFSRPCIVPPS